MFEVSKEETHLQAMEEGEGQQSAEQSHEGAKGTEDVHVAPGNANVKAMSTMC